MPAQLGMKGPFKLEENSIYAVLEANRIGNYALGDLDKNGEFIPRKIGRSDSDLLKEVLSWDAFHRYTHFSYAYASGIKQAYEKECHNYHDFFQLLSNAPHPKAPEGSDYPCPNKWCHR